MVENIQEIEPVIKKEDETTFEEKADEEPPTSGIQEDPAQMKLDL
jgi:hypothetical protein